jgi:hypothetical protein
MNRGAPKFRVTVEIKGGLGNQLFQWCAGQALARERESILIADLSKQGTTPKVHKNSIDIFNLPNTKFLRGPQASKIHSHVSRILNAISRKSPFIRDLIHKITKIFYASDYGFEPKLLDASNTKKTVGYFQTYKYYESLKPLKIELKKISSWFEEESERIRKENVIAVHIRRGDYVLESERIGLLSISYYNEALKRAIKISPNSPIWVFSDDIELAKKVLEGNRKEFLFISPPEDSNEAESMLLISMASVVIIANSTFSLWSGLLSHESQTKIAPSKWFKNDHDPRDLIPLDWLRVESTWE